MRLTHITDPHLYGGENEMLRGIATLPSLEATLANARQRDWPPDAVLVTGDLVQDDPRGYVHFRRLFGGLQLPVLCLPGNHDDPQTMRRELDCAPFVVGGVVDLGLWRIVLLDSTIPGSAAGRLGAQTLAALQSALATRLSGRRWCVCTTILCRWQAVGSTASGCRTPMSFSTSSTGITNVRGIVWGHVHQRHDALRKEVRLLATPSSCAQFLPRSDQFAIDRLPPAYRTLELKADGSIVTEVVWLSSGAVSSKSAWAAA